jgi:hypothetical protein
MCFRARARQSPIFCAGCTARSYTAHKKGAVPPSFVANTRVREMEKAVHWWCNLVGVTDPNAVQTATGIISAVSLILVLTWVFNSVFWVLRANQRH